MTRLKIEFEAVRVNQDFENLAIIASNIFGSEKNSKSKPEPDKVVSSVTDMEMALAGILGG
jgi:hypothetical protein